MKKIFLTVDGDSLAVKEEDLTNEARKWNAKRCYILIECLPGQSDYYHCRWSLSKFARDEQFRMKLALADMMDRGYIAVYDVAVLPDGTEIEL